MAFDGNNDGGGISVDVDAALDMFENQLNAVEASVKNALKNLFSSKKPGYISGPIDFSGTSGHAPYKISCDYCTLAYNENDRTLSFSDKQTFCVNGINPSKKFASVKAISSNQTGDVVTLNVTYEGQDAEPKTPIDPKAATSVTINGVKNCKGPTGEAGADNSNTDGTSWNVKPGGGTSTRYGKNSNYKIAEASLTGASNSFKGISGSVTGADISLKGISYSGSLIDLSGDLVFSFIAGISTAAVGKDLDQKSMADEIAALENELRAKHSDALVGVSDNGLDKIVQGVLEKNPYGCKVII